MSAAPGEVVAALAARGLARIYVDGGRTIQGFVTAGLIQRIVITRVPMLIGKGIALFGPVSRDARIQHVRTHIYPDGPVQSEYSVLA